MPEPVKDTPATTPAEQGTPSQQTPPAEKPKLSNADKIAKAKQEASSFLAKQILGQQKAVKEEKKPEPKEDDKEDKQEEKAEEKKESKSVDKKEGDQEDKVETKPKSERRKPAESERKEVSTDDIAEAAARGVAKALQGGKPTEKKEEAKEYSKDDLPEGFSEYYDQLVELPKLGGKWKGRDVVAEVVEHSREIEKYKATWQKKNKGQEFDPEDQEHAEFFAEHSIDIPQPDLIKATQAVAERNAKRAAVDEVESKFGPDIEKLRNREKLSRLHPVAVQADSSIDDAIASSIGDDVVAALKKGGEEVKKLAESHPYLSEVAREVAPVANGFLDHAVRIIGGVDKFDPNNRIHGQFKSDLLQIDKQLDEMESPPKLADGREFISIKEFDKLSQQAQRRYYTVSDVDAIPVVVGTFTKTIANEVASGWKARHERWSKSGSGQSKATDGTPKESKPEHKPAPTVTPSASKISEAKDDDKPKNAAQFMAKLVLGKKP